VAERALEHRGPHVADLLSLELEGVGLILSQQLVVLLAQCVPKLSGDGDELAAGIDHGHVGHAGLRGDVVDGGLDGRVLVGGQQFHQRGGQRGRQRRAEILSLLIKGVLHAWQEVAKGEEPREGRHGERPQAELQGQGQSHREGDRARRRP
jgi:hypothetical protein